MTNNWKHEPQNDLKTKNVKTNENILIKIEIFVNINKDIALYTYAEILYNT